MSIGQRQPYIRVQDWSANFGHHSGRRQTAAQVRSTLLIAQSRREDRGLDWFRRGGIFTESGSAIAIGHSHRCCIGVGAYARRCGLSLASCLSSFSRFEVSAISVALRWLWWVASWLLLPQSPMLIALQPQPLWSARNINRIRIEMKGGRNEATAAAQSLAPQSLLLPRDCVPCSDPFMPSPCILSLRLPESPRLSSLWPRSLCAIR